MCASCKADGPPVLYKLATAAEQHPPPESRDESLARARLAIRLYIYIYTDADATADTPSRASTSEVLGSADGSFSFSLRSFFRSEVFSVFKAVCNIIQTKFI